MGKHLADSLTDNYYAIGTDFYKGTFRAVSSKGESKNFTLINRNRFVDEFITLPENQYFMDFRKASDNTYLKTIIEEKQPMVSVGYKFSNWQGMFKRFYTMNMVPEKAYDSIIVVKNATPTKSIFR